MGIVTIRLTASDFASCHRPLLLMLRALWLRRSEPTTRQSSTITRIGGLLTLIKLIFVAASIQVQPANVAEIPQRIYSAQGARLDLFGCDIGFWVSIQNVLYDLFCFFQNT